MVNLATSAKTSRRGADRGFTLVELMTAVSVLTVLAAVAAPNLRSFSAAQSVKALAGDLTSDLMLARSEALKRNAFVTVTPSGTDWLAGWTVNAGTTQLGGRGAFNAGAVALAGAPASITFNQFGRVAQPAGAVRITVSAANVASTITRCVELDLSGRARAKGTSC
ncbi:MAG TPA: GspH/FimT family pseudopilin [Rubrivivax sp.]|nr:GspH/FimT family pseudopilin [Rubrivivax sp.]